MQRVGYAEYNTQGDAMSKGQRIAVFTVAMLVLFGGYLVYRAEIMELSTPGIVLVSALIMMAFTILFSEHYFTRPTDVVASTVSVLLLLSPLHAQMRELGAWYWVLWGYSALLLLTSLVSLLLLTPIESESSPKNKAARLLKSIAVKFGGGKLLWFIVFCSSLFFYVDSQSTLFLVAFAFAAAMMLLNPKKALPSLSRHMRQRPAEVARIFGVQAGPTYIAKLMPGVSPVRRFDVVGFRPNTEADNEWRVGLVIGTHNLNEEVWLKIVVHDGLVNPDKFRDSQHRERIGSVYKIHLPVVCRNIERFVGVVCERTTIERLRFEYCHHVPVQEGDLLEVRIAGSIVLYQIVEGITGAEPLEARDEAGLITGEAVQLGVWCSESRCFNRFGWVPEMGAPVSLAASLDDVEPSASEFQIGSIPNTKFPVFIDRTTAVTHHLAVLGVTGSGKSVFSRNLIRQIAADGTKVICVDFTNEYGSRLSDLINSPLISGESSSEMFRSVDAIGEELEKFPNQRNKVAISEAETCIRQNFGEALASFIQSDEKATLFELPDVTNSAGILEYTRWFFRSLFEMAKNGDFEGRRVCVVLEEAHTIVPEWNFLGIEDKRSSSVVNSIAQIALQGRKYGVGFIVIAQRTANVSKTVLTQCNSVVAFQQFDKTSADFLGNYMGQDFVASLTRLKPRHAVAVGKAFSSGTPVIFEVPEIEEPE